MKLFKQWKSHFSILLIHPNEVKIWIELDENHNYHLEEHIVTMYKNVTYYLCPEVF